MTELRTAPLTQFATLLSGGTPSKAEPTYWNGPIPWLTPKDMGQWDGTTEETVTQQAIGNGTRLAPADAIFIAVRGMSLHNEIRITRSDVPLAFNQDIKAIVPKDGIDGRFLYYALTAKKTELLDAVEAAGHGTGRLPTDRLEALNIPDLPRRDQEVIADLFSALDDKIELNRRMNETAEAMARSVFKDWFVDFGPTRAKMEGRARYLPDELWSPFPTHLDGDGKPDGWTTQPLFAQANWVNGAAYKNMHFSEAVDALPVIKIAELKNGITPNTKFTSTALGDRYRISNRELLFSWSGNPDTSIDIFIWSHGDAWLNQHIFAVRPNGSRTTCFLYFLLKLLKPEFSEIARNKQTTGLGHVTQEDLMRLQICVPDHNVEVLFNQLVGPLYELLYGNISESQTLAHTRDLLLPKLMSGEICIREAEKTVEAAA